jgi:hypothetical protein
MCFQIYVNALSSYASVTKQQVTAQWSFAVSDPDFCDHH